MPYGGRNILGERFKIVMFFQENSYGVEKRFRFIKNAIEEFRPSSVLDIGCGTGSFVTLPLAKSFPDIRFLGVDSDRNSINFAGVNNNSTNLDFVRLADLKDLDKFDLIIASEVIEHVREPEEFLFTLRERLNDKGKIIITLPNGYGPFEVATLIEAMLQISGIQRILKIIKKLFFCIIREAYYKQQRDTFALSPHITFFSFKQIINLLAKTGLKILQYSGRTFLCGFGFDQILYNRYLIDLNSRIADLLPPYLNSGWMFLLEKGESKNSQGYKRNLYANFLRNINERLIKANHINE